MKAQHPNRSVRTLCDLLVRGGLLSAGEVQVLQQRWRQEAEHPDDWEHFSKWLVEKQYATEFQVVMLIHGHVDHFFLEHYKLLDRIAKGRLAVVYRAVHRLGQIVAIKILPPSKARDPKLLARFQQQTRLACGLDHPQVVRAIGAGQDRGLHYLVMEHLAGRNLEEVLQRRGRLTPLEATYVIHQALLGLQYLHEQGMVHGNLEPANIMLVPMPLADGEWRVVTGGETPANDSSSPMATQVKILDMSLGRSVFQGHPEPLGLPLTFENQAVGSPDYLAPERAGDDKTSDIRADIYSLGCILYHALTGSPPYPEASFLGKVIRHATEKPRPLKEIDPAIPDALQLVVDWMMAKDPDQRYPTSLRASQALALFLLPPGEPTILPPEPPPPPPAPRPSAEMDFSSLNDPLGSPPKEASVISARKSEAPALSGRRPLRWLVLGALGLILAEFIGWLLGLWWTSK